MAATPSRGVGTIAGRYADKIAEKVGPVDWRHPYGCGSFGCVWPLVGDDRRVVKVSVDPTEGPVTKAIMESGLDKTLDGLVRYFDLWRIPKALRKRDAWVIVRENIKPYDGHKTWTPHPPEWWNALSDYNAAMRRAIDVGAFSDRKLKASDERAAQKAVEGADEALSILDGESKTYTLSEAIRALREVGVVLADVHLGNVGWRTHDWSDEGGQEPHESLVIFDPGHSSARPAGDIAELKGMLHGW